MPGTDAVAISFFAGQDAQGQVESNCSAIGFTYTYDTDGPSITIRTGGGYAEGCPGPAMTQYNAIGALLPRIEEWRIPQAGNLLLLDDRAAALMRGTPLPPLPTPPPGGDCGSVPAALCEEAATQAFNFGLFLTPEQRVVAWRVEDTVNTTDCPGASVSRFDVTFELENPPQDRVVTIGELNGRLHPCGDY